MDDPLPTCCIEGCDCGHDPALRRELRRQHGMDRGDK
jgi:hypothetical protein